MTDIHNSDAEQETNEGLEVVDSEVLDEQTSLPTYEILTYPADYTLEVLVDKWKKDQIEIPRFQRGFVWTQVQASKLIESFLLGLPVPAIFLFSDSSTNNLLVVDGQQRLRTIAYFFEGYFGEERRGRRPVFRLTGLHDGSPWSGKTYADLADGDQTSYARLNDSVLRAFVIKQLDPNDGTSIYHVFERLNTGGTALAPQEIRNCVHHGPMNDFLLELNEDRNWREIFGRREPQKRQRDVELVLRFLALYYASSDYDRPMKVFLNSFMDKHRHDTKSQLGQFSDVFVQTSASVLGQLGPRPFHVRTGLNAAVFDSVFTAFAHHLEGQPADLAKRYQGLVTDEEFTEWTRSNTTDKDVVSKRLAKAAATLFG